MAPKPDTRTQLIEATISSISAGGESSVRVGLVAAEVGVREPSVYHFFKNREALIEAAQIERYRRSYEEIIVPFETAAQLSDTREEFERAVQKILKMSYLPDRIGIRSIRLGVMGAAQTSPAIADAINQVNRNAAILLARVIETSQERGWTSTAFDAMAIAYWIMGQVNGRVMAEMDSSAVDLAEWDRVSIAAVLAIFRHQPE